MISPRLTLCVLAVAALFGVVLGYQIIHPHWWEWVLLAAIAVAGEVGFELLRRWERRP